MISSELIYRTLLRLLLRTPLFDYLIQNFIKNSIFFFFFFFCY